MMLPEVYTVKEVAIILKTSDSTVLRMCAAGTLYAINLATGRGKKKTIGESPKKHCISICMGEGNPSRGGIHRPCIVLNQIVSDLLCNGGLFNIPPNTARK